MQKMGYLKISLNKLLNLSLINLFSHSKDLKKVDNDNE
jgi:hypothetical protein